MSEEDKNRPRPSHANTHLPPAALADERGERWAFYTFTFFLLLLFATAAWLLFGEHSHVDKLELGTTFPNSESITIYEPIQPLPLGVELDPAKVALGQKLFFDPRLSGDNTIACVSCHDLNHGGDDNKPLPTGIGGSVGEVNSLSVFNAAYHVAWFWDGRAATLSDQIDGPIHNPREMGSTWQELVLKLGDVEEYRRAFAEIYEDGVTTDNIKDAIVSFERSLITPNARFDRYLRGQSDAIDESEKQGYQLFKEYGCIACHQGVNIGGNMFQVFGIAKNYFDNRGNVTKADLGRYNVTGLEEDRHRFRVPSLRNVELTSPYFHDGSAKTLEQAVRIMAEYQLGRTIPDEDIALIVAFLKTLTGEYPYQGQQ